MRLAAAVWAVVLAVPTACGQARYGDAAWRELWRRIERGIEVESLLRPAPGMLPTRQSRPREISPGQVASAAPPRSRPELVRRIACQLGVHPALALALIEQESGFQHPVRGQAGELGAAQILPATARFRGFDMQRLQEDFAYNVRAGLSILKGLLEETGDEAEALHAYNGGRGWRTLPPEAQRAVQRYAAQVLARKSRYAGASCPAPGSAR